MVPETPEQREVWHKTARLANDACAKNNGIVLNIPRPRKCSFVNTF
jgi:hypothetical protein